jgi:hypothetical protein
MIVAGPPHPHPLPTRGGGEAPIAARQALSLRSQNRRLPPPLVGEGWGGGATCGSMCGMANPC